MAKHLREKLERGALGALVLLAAWTQTLAAEAPRPALPAALERALDRLEPELGESERERMARLFSGWDALVAYLPVADLRHVRFGDGWLELRFDFGKDDHRELEIRGTTKAYWDAKKREIVTEKGRTERVRLSSRIRLQFDENGLRGLREGDLEVKRGFWWDLEVRTVEERRIEKDSDGRPRVRTDRAGKAELRGGKPVFVECDHWLVMEARGNRMEVALDEPGSQARP